MISWPFGFPSELDGTGKEFWGVGEDEKREFNGVMVVDGGGGRR